jgi:hypothetical protein
MSSVEPEYCADELDGSEERAGELIIACCDCSEAFELTEEALDEIAFAIEGEIDFAFDESIGFGRNDGCDAALVQGLDQGICIIGLVCEKGFGLDLFEQRRGLTKVGCLAGRKRHGHGVAESVDDHMDLGCQTASGSADGLIAAVFFRAPALC